MDIKKAIKSRGFTLADVAEKLGVTKQSFGITVGNNPTVKTLQDIAKVVGCSVSDLVSDDEPILQSQPSPAVSQSPVTPLVCPVPEAEELSVRIGSRVVIDVNGRKYRLIPVEGEPIGNEETEVLVKKLREAEEEGRFIAIIRQGKKAKNRKVEVYDSPTDFYEDAKGGKHFNRLKKFFAGYSKY